jgi:uncharacterized repeat protein (TIGR02543 family)
LLTSAALTPIAGTDTNILSEAQSVVDAVYSGVTVTLGSSANSEIASPSGNITYGSSAVTGNVTFTLTKNAASDNQTVSITVPAASANHTTTYSVTYDGNGSISGSVPAATCTYDQGAVVTVLGNTGTLSEGTDYAFAGWNTASNGSGSSYQPGNGFSITGNIILYAQWTSSSVTIAPPVISLNGVAVTTPQIVATESQAVSISDPNRNSQSVPDSVNDVVYYSIHGANPEWDISYNHGLQTQVYNNNPFTLDQSAEVCAAVYNQTDGWSQPVSITITFVVPATSYGVINTSVSAPPTTISFSNNSNNAVDVSNLLSSSTSNTTEPLPPLVIQTSNSLGNDSVVVSVYAGTTITATTSGNTQWDGIIVPPTPEPTAMDTVQTSAAASDIGEVPTVSFVIEIGENDTPLTFNQPVRILFPDATGKLVGYYQSGTFEAIPAIGGDSAAFLSGPDGYYDNGTDLIVWTNHFTDYALYTETEATLDQVVQSITSTPITPAAGATSLTLPTATGFTITIASSSNPGVITTTGAIIPPVTATTVNLTLTITGPSGPTSSTTTTGITVTVPARPVTATTGSTGGGGGHATALSISTGSLNPATVGVSYSTTIIANGNGTPPYTFSVASGSLPDGLTLAPGTGIISGTPTTTGQYSFSITVTDATGNSASAAYALMVNSVEASQHSPTSTTTLSDITGNWAQKDIEKLVSLGYISGYPDGTYKPDSQITRAEFCVIMDKVLNLAPSTNETQTFTDVNSTAWYDQTVETAVYAGIVKGYNDGTFRPNAPISRQEMACVLVQALGEQSEAWSNVNHKTGFTDNTRISSWARGFVVVAVKDGLLKGYPDNSFRPQDNATRAEACAMIMNFLNAQQ